MSNSLNRFQEDTRDRALAILQSRGIPVDVNAADPAVGVKLTFGSFEAWVYPEGGAGVLGGGLDRRFELYDYRSLRALQAAYLRLIDALSYPRSANWMGFLAEAEAHLRGIANGQPFQEAIECFETHAALVDGELRDFLVNSIYEMGADPGSFADLVEFIAKKPSQADLISYMET